MLTRRFFHASASARRKINTITSLARNDESRTDSQEGLCDLANDYFSKLFAGQQNDVSQVIKYIHVKLSNADNDKKGKLANAS